MSFRGASEPRITCNRPDQIGAPGITCNFNPPPVTVTDPRLHEITAEIRNSGFQDDPEISCNSETEAALPDRAPITRLRPEPSERGTYIGTTYLSLSNPSFDATEIGDRRPTFREVIDAGIARRPRTCASCGSDEIAPVFDPTVDYFSGEACGDMREYRL